MNNIKVIPVRDAVGNVLAHDMTQIIKGVSKKAKFKKGHIIREEDIDTLISMGKEHIYILELDDETYHENDAAIVLSNLCLGNNIESSDISEGRINLKSKVDGVLKINTTLLEKINGVDGVIISTKFNNKVVKEGDIVAATKIVPLFIDKISIKTCEEFAKNDKVLEVIPFKNLKAGVIITGNEVFDKKIEDGFKDFLPARLKKYGTEIISYEYVKDDSNEIASAIEKLIGKVDVVLCAGGMSVDPDDATPYGIRKSSTEIITYGTPVLPGAMFMVSYSDKTPILGLPGSVMFYEKTVFDFIMPLIAIEEKITKALIVSMAHGGLL